MGAFDDLLPNCVKHAKAMGEIEKRLEEKIGGKKMRLIDADKLVNDIAEHITVKAVSRVLAITQGQPTIDAIPVEWVEEYCAENWAEYSSQHDAIRRMLEEWRKE